MPGSSFEELGFRVGDKVRCVSGGWSPYYMVGTVLSLYRDLNFKLVGKSAGSQLDGTCGDWELVEENTSLITEETFTTYRYKNYPYFNKDKGGLIRLVLVDMLADYTTPAESLINHKDEIIALLKELDK